MILFRFRDSWHVPSSLHHFLSALKSITPGNQIMIAGRSPCMIFSHKKRLLELKFPKYMPFKQVDHFLLLKFKNSHPGSPFSTAFIDYNTTYHSVTSKFFTTGIFMSFICRSRLQQDSSSNSSTCCWNSSDYKCGCY